MTITELAKKFVEHRTKAQEAMVADGLPAAAIIPTGERAAAWKGKKLTTVRDIKTPPKDEDAATKALRKELAAAEATKKAERFARLKQLKQETTMKKTSTKKVAAPKVAKAAKAAKPASKAKAVAKAVANARKPTSGRYDWAGAEAAAATGKVPTAPDYSAPTHARFLPIMEAINAAVQNRNVKHLKDIEISPISSTPKSMARYRDICVTALSAKG